MIYLIEVYIKDERIKAYISNDVPRVGEALDFMSDKYGRIFVRVESVVRFIDTLCVNISCYKIP